MLRHPRHPRHHDSDSGHGHDDAGSVRGVRCGRWPRARCCALHSDPNSDRRSALHFDRRRGRLPHDQRRARCAQHACARRVRRARHCRRGPAARSRLAAIRRAVCQDGVRLRRAGRRRHRVRCAPLARRVADGASAAREVHVPPGRQRPGLVPAAPPPVRRRRRPSSWADHAAFSPVRRRGRWPAAAQSRPPPVHLHCLCTDWARHPAQFCAGYAVHAPRRGGDARSWNSCAAWLLGTARCEITGAQGARTAAWPLRAIMTSPATPSGSMRRHETVMMMKKSGRI